MRTKGFVIAVIFILSAISILGCTKSEPVGSTGGQTTIELTLQELSQHNGQNGKPAYVAVDGVIYDVTNSSKWRNGKHNGYEAGHDLTDPIKTKSPHGVSKLNSVPAIGKIKEE